VIPGMERLDAAVAAATECPVCGSSHTKLYLDGAPPALDNAAFGSSRTELSFGRILRCRDCGFGFAETRPAEDQLKRLYRQMDVAVYESEVQGRTRTARRHRKILQRYVSKPGRILDVGCASGRFLSECASAGWTVTGLEPSRILCQEAQRLLGGGAPIFPITLQEADFPESSFNAVTMWDVLEHVPCPREFLRQALCLLKPGGLLFVNVPNLDSLQARCMRRRWPLFLPEHLNYFTRESLARCCTQSGVRLIALGSRPVSFSIGYIVHRAGQHVPLLRPLGRIAARLSIADAVVPVWMGELYAVWNKTNASGRSQDALVVEGI
jgi:2-polyprenyl-3-methyl-5-hydroxy-6-metoxy-1,4-benzoquinol methylase